MINVMKGAWAVTMVFGIALMLGLSSVPVFADPPENNCVILPGAATTICAKELEAGQHSKLIIAPTYGQILNDSTCHYNVSDSGTVWAFVPDHGKNCEEFFTVHKSTVKVRGST